MQLWYLNYDENNKDDFPQLFYKDNYVGIYQQTILTEQIKKIFLLTHREKSQQINEIYNNFHSLPFKDLHNMIFTDPNYEFQLEYMVVLLNTFNIIPLSLN